MGSLGQMRRVAAALGQGLLQAVGTVGLPLLVTLVIRSRREVRDQPAPPRPSAISREQDAQDRRRGVPRTGRDGP